MRFEWHQLSFFLFFASKTTLEKSLFSIPANNSPNTKYSSFWTRYIILQNCMILVVYNTRDTQS